MSLNYLAKLGLGYRAKNLLKIIFAEPYLHSTYVSLWRL